MLKTIYISARLISCQSRFRYWRIAPSIYITYFHSPRSSIVNIASAIGPSQQYIYMFMPHPMPRRYAICRSNPSRWIGPCQIQRPGSHLLHSARFVPNSHENARLKGISAFIREKAIFCMFYMWSPRPLQLQGRHGFPQPFFITLTWICSKMHDFQHQQALGLHLFRQFAVLSVVKVVLNRPGAETPPKASRSQQTARQRFFWPNNSWARVILM